MKIFYGEYNQKPKKYCKYIEYNPPYAFTTRLNMSET